MPKPLATPVPPPWRPVQDLNLRPTTNQGCSPTASLTLTVPGKTSFSNSNYYDNANAGLKMVRLPAY